ncbi:MAG TPA: hypothetical protein VFP43_07255 [Mesorhizobium sp.]|nr:hypothetical protein [Mesorhizobium sp.]
MRLSPVDLVVNSSDFIENDNARPVRIVPAAGNAIPKITVPVKSCCKVVGSREAEFGAFPKSATGRSHFLRVTKKVDRIQY